MGEVKLGNVRAGTAFAVCRGVILDSQERCGVHVTCSRVGAKLLTLLMAGGLMLLSAAPRNAQWPLHKKKKVNKSTSADNTAETEKIINDKDMATRQHSPAE